MIKLGSKVKDIISKFEGIASARHDYLYGCVRITVTPSEMKDGTPIDSQVFDEQQLEVLKEMKPKMSKDSTAGPGGPRSTPSPKAAPKR